MGARAAGEVAFEAKSQVQPEEVMATGAAVTAQATMAEEETTGEQEVVPVARKVALVVMEMAVAETVEGTLAVASTEAVAVVPEAVELKKEEDCPPSNIKQLTEDERLEVIRKRMIEEGRGGNHTFSDDLEPKIPY